MKTPQKKKCGARHVDLWHDVSQTFSCLHEIYPNDLCQIIRPHQTSRGILPKNTSSKFHPPCAWRSKKCKSLRSLPPQREPWSAPARSVVTEAVDTEAAAAVVAAENVHSIGHVAPYRCVVVARCGRRSARGQLTPAIGLPKVAQMF